MAGSVLNRKCHDVKWRELERSGLRGASGKPWSEHYMVTSENYMVTSENYVVTSENYVVTSETTWSELNDEVWRLNRKHEGERWNISEVNGRRLDKKHTCWKNKQYWC